MSDVAGEAPGIALLIEDEPAMERFAARLALLVVPELGTGFTIDLRGALGVGKTTFVRALARSLGVPEHVPVASPTFTIARSYRLAPPTGPAGDLIHIDAYRLSGPEDLESVGFEEMCGAGTLTCVEWGGRVEEGLPRDRLEISIEMDTAAMQAPPEAGGIPTCPRSLYVRGHGPRSSRVLASLGSST
jgi:tRNA threonylcarbamoyl adenosine modification protein YjeE